VGTPQLDGPHARRRGRSWPGGLASDARAEDDHEGHRSFPYEAETVGGITAVVLPAVRFLTQRSSVIGVRRRTVPDAVRATTVSVAGIGWVGT